MTSELETGMVFVKDLSVCSFLMKLMDKLVYSCEAGEYESLGIWRRLAD